MLMLPLNETGMIVKINYNEPIKEKLTLRFQTLISTFIFLCLSLCLQPIPMQVN